MKKTLKKLTACAVALGVAISAAAGAAFAWFSNGVAGKGFEASVAPVPKIQTLVKAGTWIEGTVTYAIANVATSQTETASVKHQVGAGYISLAGVYGNTDVSMTVDLADTGTGWTLAVMDMETSEYLCQWDFDALMSEGKTSVSQSLGTLSAGEALNYFFGLDTDGSLLPVTFTFTAVEG